MLDQTPEINLIMGLNGDANLLHVLRYIVHSLEYILAEFPYYQFENRKWYIVVAGNDSCPR